MRDHIKSLVERGILRVDKKYVVQIELPDSELQSNGGSLESFVSKREGELILAYVKESKEPFMMDTKDLVCRHPTNRSTTVTRTINMYIFSSIAQGIMSQEFEKYSDALSSGNKAGYADWMKEEGMWFPANNEDAVTREHRRQNHRQVPYAEESMRYSRSKTQKELECEKEVKDK